MAFPVDNSNNTERIIRTVTNSTYGDITFSTSGFNALNFTLSNPSGNPNMLLEGSNDGAYWTALQPVALNAIPGNLNATLGFYNIAPSTAYQISKPSNFVRLSQLTGTTQPTAVIITLFNGSIQAKNNASLDLPTKAAWYFASPSGGVAVGANVEIAPQLNQSITNVVKTIDINNFGTIDTEVRIIASTSTVIWRTFVKAGQFIQAQFTPALRTTATNAFTPLSVFVVATGATVHINAQGTTINS